MNKKTILIVDDEPINLNIVADILYGEYQIRIAKSGETALEMIEKKRPDLILLDVMMPHMSGHEVATELTSNLDTSDIPFIFLTGKSDPRSIMEGFNYGAVDYIRKPFSKEELLARIATQLKIDDLQKSLSGKAEMKIMHCNEIMDAYVISFVTDLDGHITDVSQAFCEDRECTKDEFLQRGQKLMEYLNISQELWSSIEHEATWSGETRVQGSDGNERSIRTKIIPILDDEGEVKVGYRVIQKNL